MSGEAAETAETENKEWETSAGEDAGSGLRRATSAAGTASSASTRLYDVRTQATVVISTSNSRSTSGSASVTTDESASAIPMARPSSIERALIAASV